MNIKLDRAKQIYEKKYKALMIIPFIVLLISLSFLGFQRITTGEFVDKDVSLKGGTLITIQTDQEFAIHDIEQKITAETGKSVNVKALRSMGTGGTIGYIIEVETGLTKDEILDSVQKATGLVLAQDQYSLDETSPSLGGSFWFSAIKAILLAFVFMSIVVFYYFRVPTPSAAIVLSAACDLIGTLAITNMLGLKLSTGGIAALLMLIGYSVDSDILLTTRLLKRHTTNVMDGVYSAMKTGLTMQGTTLAALVVMWVLSPAQVLKQIALVLMIGLLLDMMNTWIQNVGLLRWHLERKNG